MEQGTPREPCANIDSTRSCSLSLCSPPCWVQLPFLLFCVPGILAVLASLNAVLCFLTSGRVLSSGWVPSSCTTAWKASSGSSVQFSHSVMSDSLWPHEPQLARLPCPSPTPGVYPNPCPSSRWCHPTISTSVVPFSSCPQSFPTSGSLQMSQLFASGGQIIGASASTSILPVNTQDWSPLGWTGLNSLQAMENCSSHLLFPLLSGISILHVVVCMKTVTKF